jgi:hypothetical protein
MDHRLVLLPQGPYGGLHNHEKWGQWFTKAKLKADVCLKVGDIYMFTHAYLHSLKYIVVITFVCVLGAQDDQVQEGQH